MKIIIYDACTEQYVILKSDMMIDIYTDGGCSGNPGPGGWGFVILFDNDVIKGSGSDPDTTNNRMELTAVIEALGCLKKKLKDYQGEWPSGSSHRDVIFKVRVFTDSVYVRNGITAWIEKWVKNGWRTSDRKDVKNRELWIRLKELSDTFAPEWIWVKGHAGNKWNEECDLLVRKEIKVLTD